MPEGPKQAAAARRCYDFRVLNRRRWEALAAVVTWAALGAVAVADPDPAPADLGWPATTRTIELRRQTRVLAEPGTGARLGTIGRGAHAAFTRIALTRDRCKAWVELAPRGWVCARDLKPRDAPLDPPVAASAGPPIAAGSRYADIRKDGADAFGDADAVRSGVPTRRVPDKTFVAVNANARSLKVGGVRYLWTDQGYIASDRLSWQSPSEFAGIEVATAPPPAWPFAWVVPHVHGGKVIVRDAAQRKGAKVRELVTRALVPVLETSAGFARIGTDEWVELRDLRIAAIKPRPAGVVDGERWIDVDLDEQTLVAYDGDAPVYATLISTGRVKWETPTGVYRIDDKAEKVRMQAPVGAAEEWNVADVPYSMRFRTNFALHGTYWHDGFGRRHSHGCVNLSPQDAHHLYDWTAPAVPAGWTEVEGDPLGTPVRVRSAAMPDPPWRDVDGKVRDPR